MQVSTVQEALVMTCEMEASAVQLYTRALSLMEQLGRRDEPLYEGLDQMRRDEREHLRQFRALCGEEDVAPERRMALAAAAQNVLFEGGLMGAARQGLLESMERMLRFAMRCEAISAQKYREFAAMAQNPSAREALLMIASEEDGHLAVLEAQYKKEGVFNEP